MTFSWVDVAFGGYQILGTSFENSIALKLGALFRTERWQEK